jgi:3'-phosphoadenosine 5'-phosphosulfate sulfotransferase (PAPS reductase)/FAD synthetase
MPTPAAPSPAPEPDAQPRAAADLAAHEAAIVHAARALLASHHHVALSYSGGAESGLLLHLLHPLRDWLSVFWVNPGALPHEAEHVRRAVEGWPRFIEIGSDREAAWREHGLPTFLVPTSRVPELVGDGPRPPKPLTSFNACCWKVRNAPAQRWAAAHGVSLVIHGQRRGEGTGMYDPALVPPHWGPLASWTRADVLARVAHHDIPLPLQFAEGYPQSFECAVCPADLNSARLDFLRRHYPVEHAESLRRLREANAPALESAEAIRNALAAAEAATVDRAA